MMKKLMKRAFVAISGAMIRFSQSAAAVRAAVAGLVVLAGSQPAFADGWNTAFTNLIGLSQQGAQLVVWVSFLLGLSAFAFGGYMLWRKGDERHGHDIKMSYIVFPFLGGAVMMAISYFALMTVQTMGGSASDIHNTTAF